METTIRDTFERSTDIQLSYRSWGRGTPVIFLHGLADHGRVWEAVATAIGQQYRCIAPDLRGHGESSKPSETEYDANLLADDLEQLVKHLGLEQVAVVAHSWAAKVALIWAQQHPERISQLALVDPFFVNKFARIWKVSFPLLYRTLPFLKVMGPFETYAAAETVARGLKQYQGWSPLQQNAFKAGMEEKPDGRWGSKFSISARNGVFLDTVRVAGLTSPMALPTTLILPIKGLNRTAAQLKPYKQYLTHLTVTDVPGNHWPHLVEPEAFEKAIAQFLSSSDTPSQ